MYKQYIFIYRSYSLGLIFIALSEKKFLDVLLNSIFMTDSGVSNNFNTLVHVMQRSRWCSWACRLHDTKRKT